MADDLRPAISAADHARGAVAAPVKLVLYGDYECPYSRQTQRAVDDIFVERSGQVRYVFRHFPLAKIHPHAQEAAMVAEAAGAQGQFWAMHDLLYERQGHLQVPDLVRYAAELGLDDQRVADELRAEAHLQSIRDHVRGGVGSGVEATPTVFINGRRWGQRYDLPELIDAIDEELSRND